MPPLSEFLANREQLRLAVQTNAPREIARYLKDIRKGEYDMEAIKTLTMTLFQLIWEEHGSDAADEFMAVLGR